MTAITPETIAAIQRVGLARGDVRVLLHRTQLQALDAFRQSSARTFAVDCSRRWGKTIFSAVLAFDQALRVPKSVIRYVAPTKLHGRQFVIPAFDWVAAQLPESMRPTYDRQDSTWRWVNGSVCHLGSGETMGDVEAQVGTECHLAIVDEAGKIRSDLLRHLHRSVLRAQFLTTGGRCIVPSTPAISPAHYLTEIVATAQSQDALARFTIDDCDHVPVSEREDMIRDLGGRASTEVRRELYCEHVAERSRLIVPEWADVATECTRDTERPTWLDWYVAADFGFEDLTVCLFGWFDFEAAQLVVEDEVAMHQASGIDVGYAIKAAETRLGITKALRIADAPPQLLADLSHPQHGPGVAFGPAIKDDADAALNQLRMLIQQKRIRVHSRCKTLIAHLTYGTWNERRTSFDRAEGYGHWDAIDALKYMSRVIDWRKNPAPVVLPHQTRSTHHIPQSLRTSEQRQRFTIRRGA